MNTLLKTMMVAVAVCGWGFLAGAADKHEHHHKHGPTPRGGRLLEKTEPHAELVVEKDRSVSIHFYGEDMKSVPATTQTVTACRIAVEKSSHHAVGAVAFSDAFFPFADGPEILINAGVTCLVHPGGSKRDSETFDLCNSRGVTCLVTGTRHFRH